LEAVDSLSTDSPPFPAKNTFFFSRDLLLPASKVRCVVLYPRERLSTFLFAAGLAFLVGGSFLLPEDFPGTCLVPGVADGHLSFRDAFLWGG